MQKDFNMYSKQFLIGQRADTSLCQIDSYAAESNIQFGSAVKRGTNKDKQCLPLGDSTEFLGIALRDDIQRVGWLKEKSMISVMTKGRVVVRTTAAVVAGDTAYVQADGSINNNSNINEEEEEEEAAEAAGVEIGVFASTQASENELVILEIN